MTFCYCKDDKESLIFPPYNLIIIMHIPHKNKKISSGILCTCVASQLFTKHHGSGIYFLYLILLDSQFVMLNKMCTRTLTIALLIFSEHPFIRLLWDILKIRCAYTSFQLMSICHLEQPINILIRQWWLRIEILMRLQWIL